MSSFIDSIFDDMSIDELVCRLPGENALKAMKRRYNNVQDIYDILHSADGKNLSNIKEVKEYINEVVRSADVEEVNKIFKDSSSFSKLFSILNENSKYNLVENGKYVFPIKTIFNLSEKDDLESMTLVLDRILGPNNQEDAPTQALTVLDRMSADCFNALSGRVLADKRPGISSTILSISNGVNYRLVSEHQKMIALKSFAKLPASYRGPANINSLDFKLFQNLKPLERLMALSRYLNNTQLKKQPFDPMPDREEMQEALFAGCFLYNDLVEDIMKQYNAIVGEPEEDAE